MIYQILEEPMSKDELQGRSDIPQTLGEFMAEIKESNLDARSFAIRLREMVLFSFFFYLFQIFFINKYTVNSLLLILLLFFFFFFWVVGYPPTNLK